MVRAREEPSSDDDRNRHSINRHGTEIAKFFPPILLPEIEPGLLLALSPPGSDSSEILRRHARTVPVETEEVPNRTKWLTFADPADPEDPGMSSKSLKNAWNCNVFGDFGQALDKYGPIVTAIGQIYADSARNWTNIRR